MKILGVDPGLEVTGYGVIEAGANPAPRLLEAGLIRTPRARSLAHRLFVVGHEIRRLFVQHRPDLVAVEDLYSYYKTPKPAILMGHVRGVVLEAAAEAKIPVASYLPTRVKRAVAGRGHASKEQIARLVRSRLRLSSKPVPSDVSDALAVALCHWDAIRMRLNVGNGR